MEVLPVTPKGPGGILLKQNIQPLKNFFKSSQLGPFSWPYE